VLGRAQRPPTVEQFPNSKVFHSKSATAPQTAGTIVSTW
jgi:hypothetical protein